MGSLVDCLINPIPGLSAAIKPWLDALHSQTSEHAIELRLPIKAKDDFEALAVEEDRIYHRIRASSDRLLYRRRPVFFGNEANPIFCLSDAD